MALSRLNRGSQSGRRLGISAIALLMVTVRSLLCLFRREPFAAKNSIMLHQIYEFLCQWQTLLAGIGALVAAVFTIRKMQAQINQAAEFQKDQLRRESRAARIVLPLALSEITEYSIKCIKLLEPYAPAKGDGPTLSSDTKPLPLPNSIFDTMKEVARTEDAAIADSVGEIISWLQIQHSRLENLIRLVSERSTKRISRHEAQDAILDAAELYALSARLFPYARSLQPEHNEDFRTKLKNALIIAGIVDVDRSEFPELIDRRQNPSLTVARNKSNAPPGS